MFRFGKLFRKVLFFLSKVLSKSDFGKCENAFPNQLPKQLSKKKLFMCDMALTLYFPFLSGEAKAKLGVLPAGMSSVTRRHL